MMEPNALPTEAFESLLPTLADVLAITRNQERGSSVTLTPQEKQELLQAINEFKAKLSHAKDLAATMPGGELMLEDQDEIIAVLEKLRDKKRAQLQSFGILLEQARKTDDVIRVDS